MKKDSFAEIKMNKCQTERGLLSDDLPKNNKKSELFSIKNWKNILNNYSSSISKRENKNPNYLIWIYIIRKIKI